MMKNGDIVQNLMELFEGRIKNINLITGEARRVAAKEFSQLENKSIGNVLKLCESLLETRTWAMGVIEYDWAFRVRAQYTIDTFEIFENWLKTYVTGWGDCDDFCTHIWSLARQIQ